jgi:hypothetical protein
MNRRSFLKTTAGVAVAGTLDSVVAPSTTGETSGKGPGRGWRSAIRASLRKSHPRTSWPRRLPIASSTWCFAA